ncbi:acetyltransferase [Naegleria gruberi]|uniref:Acetyltransferase n=1 Tax=Naegleria gruberi TaxID=5762 RepID=D2VRX0_NAEGR|nr:acetyltransferase [Naegleria gruberi]EFC40463.1 acetyltransferase [Naegleria gruberi]|eukprot:XP_002673207.1 acetyltransferase [Naegleria gruberi strain NEG-M]
MGEAHRNLTSVETSSDGKESMICIKPEYKQVDDPAQYYATRGEEHPLQLMESIRKQADLAFLLLFLPDTRCKSLKLVDGKLESNLEEMKQLGLVNEDGTKLTRYAYLHEKLNISFSYLYYALIYHLHKDNTQYLNDKLDKMTRELNYKSVTQPFNLLNFGKVYFGNADFVVKTVETKEEMAKIIDCVQDGFASMSAGPMSSEIVMSGQYPLHDANYDWVFVMESDGSIVSTGQVFYGEKTHYVNNVCTRPRSRGKGYASFVMTAIIELCKEKSKDKPLILQASPKGLKMYHQLGFDYRFDYEIGLFIPYQ